MLPTLCTEAACAVFCSYCHPVTQSPPMLGLRSRTLSAALPLAVRTTRWPLTPLSPAAIHCRGKHKDRAIECEYMHMLLYKEMQWNTTGTKKCMLLILQCIFLIALWNFTAKHFQGNSCATKNNVPLKVSKTCTKLVFLIWSIKRLHQFAFPPPYGLKDPLFLLIWKQRHPVYAQTQMQRKTPSEGDIWQRGDNVWRSALYSTDNFFLNLNLMSVFLYTPLWLKS